ncbi:alpha-L-arabinofuranosidase C-terminal domain-containing protein [Geofilum sp. OHC36d9]|uniref:alpha-L-arabinofuranosidase C-terminal domain-containing protein n=1 Tax=Geofilum sp. OHC36d9 TaxID=3458413 RepID=UPI004034BE8D
MNRIIFAISLLLSIFWSNNVKASKLPADSVYLFAYATTKNDNHNGLHFAWSDDGKHWNTIGPEFAFIKSDYGAWGSEKKMFSPFLFRDKQGLWHLIWSLNQYDDVFAHAAVDDLIHWRRQSYPQAAKGLNCLMPEVFYNNKTDKYNITWLSVVDNDTICYNSTTSDFKNYTPAIQIATEKRKNLRQTFIVSGKREQGTLHKVKRAVVEKLIAEHQKTVQRNKLWSETTKDDSVRFASLKSLEIAITADAGKPKQISDKLIGVFFEDINYAADGGIYAELIENRGFEYNPSDKKGRDTTWNSLKAWSVTGNMAHRVDTVNPLHPNNPHHVVLTVNHKGGSLVNEGFNGIAVKAGEKYNFSIFANVTKGKKSHIVVRLSDSHNQTIAETTINKITSGWHQYNAILSAKTTDSHARLEIIPQTPGELALDMISLFPQKTFKGRKNGLRADLAQTIADIKPQFVRFPGGCVAHGDGLGNIYHWKNTIGPLEARKPQRNIWNYHQSAGLGYFEYFQFCEDINAEPVPIVAAGVPCQNSSCGGAGQQGGIPMCEMDNYVQDVLDLVEWANGSADTYWGHKRAEAGHPEPFNLKYIGVGNEDLITDIFEERFTMIYNALKDKHPEITVIGTVGPWFEGTDYREGWALANKLNIPMVDEHYYQSPGWFIYNQDFYDSYDRSKTKVYLGEYAAHLPGRPNNLETALAEAIYLTSLERNGDIVAMASYAPLLAKDGFTQWNPDLIYFNNSEVKPTVGYYVQKLFGNNAGNTYINSHIDLKEEYSEAVKKRIAASFVHDNKTNDLIIKLVNILPVQIKTNLNLQSLPISSSTATRTLLTGKPEDKKARPKNDMITISNNFDVELPPYSFTVIRLKMK